MSNLQGGKFGDGFAGAGVSEALSPAVSSLHNEGGRVTVAAIIGGTASKLSGGKFINGAFSAAFGQLFNDEAHRLTSADNTALTRAATKEKSYVDSFKTPEEFAQAFPGTEDAVPGDLAMSMILVQGTFDEDLGVMIANSYSRFVLEQIAISIGEYPQDVLVGVMTGEMGAAGKGIQDIYDFISTASRASSITAGNVTVYCTAQGTVGCIFAAGK